MANSETPLAEAAIQLGERLFSEAIATTLLAPASDRVVLFERLVARISERTQAPGSDCTPWTCTIYTGTDGSRIFRGGIGGSLVIDPKGRMWRARSYEDFDTTYDITPVAAEIRTLTPLYAEMREYLPRSHRFVDPDT